MQKLNQKELIVGTIIIVLVIAAAVLLFLNYSKNHKATPTAQTKNQAQKISKTEVDKTKLPDNFPTDIPLEKNAVVTQNYNASNQGSLSQATRGFVSKATLDANLGIYKDYFTKSGYKIANTIDKPDYKMLYAIKDNNAVQVSISRNTVNKETTVVISSFETK